MRKYLFLLLASAVLIGCDIQERNRSTCEFEFTCKDMRNHPTVEVQCDSIEASQWESWGSNPQRYLQREEHTNTWHTTSDQINSVPICKGDGGSFHDARFVRIIKK